MDESIRSKGFLGEGKRNGTVVVIKTHGADPGQLKRYKRAILIYREPKESVLAEYNRRRAGHVGAASKQMLLKNDKCNVN